MQAIFEVESPDVLTWQNVTVLAQLLEICHDNAIDAASRKCCGDFLSYNIKYEGSGVVVVKNFISVQSVG